MPGALLDVTRCARAFVARSSIGVLSGVALLDGPVPAVAAPEGLDPWDVAIFAGVGVGAAGGGAATESKIGGGAYRFGLQTRYRRVALTIQAGGVDGGDSEHTGFLYGPIGDEFRDVGALLGYVVAGDRKWRTTVSSGVGLTHGKRVVGSREEIVCFLGCGPQEVADVQDFDDRASLLLELGVSGISRRFAGIAFVAHANVNGEETFGTLTVNLLAGR